MAPLPENNTPRLKVTYQNAVSDHDMIFRCVADTDVDELEGAVNNMLLFLEDLVAASEVTNVQFAVDGSNFFFPRPASVLMGLVFGTGPATPETNARFLQFGGRSTGGRRTKFYVFGYTGATSDFRLTAAENLELAGAIETLNTTAQLFTAIDGLQTLWYPYANNNLNDHWVKEARQG